MLDLILLDYVSQLYCDVYHFIHISFIHFLINEACKRFINCVNVVGGIREVIFPGFVIPRRLAISEVCTYS